MRKEIFMLSKILEFGQSECGITLPRGNPVDHVRKPAEGRARDRRLTADDWKTLERECLCNKSFDGVYQIDIIWSCTSYLSRCFESSG